jgi:hypothetical protein
MTERDPRPSLKDRRKQGGKEERRKSLDFSEHSVSFPPPLPVSSLLLVIDNRARFRAVI